MPLTTVEFFVAASHSKSSDVSSSEAVGASTSISVRPTSQQKSQSRPKTLDGKIIQLPYSHRVEEMKNESGPGDSCGGWFRCVIDLCRFVVYITVCFVIEHSEHVFYYLLCHQLKLATDKENEIKIERKL